MFEQLVAPLNLHFLSAYDKLTNSSVPLLTEVNNHVHGTHGKQLRPTMTMLTALCCGFPPDAPADHPLFSVTAAIETLHSSTLLHDDVVDNSNTRRGKPTINNLWSNKIAVLAGDFYLAKVMETLNKVNNNEITSIINDAVIQMSEGELLQQQQSGIYSTDIETYLTIIEKKTASFMSACCQTGASFATDNPIVRDYARIFGLSIGMAFQIRDDILDYMPSSITGKPQGNDLCEGKCTLPLILTLLNSDNKAKESLLLLLNNVPLSDTNMRTIIQTVSEGGHLASATLTLGEYLSKAHEALQYLPDNQYRNALFELTENINLKL